MKAGHKFLTYQEAVEIFTKDEKFQESVKDHAVVVGKYCLQYVYLQKQEDKTKAHPYWVYPKHYKAIIDKATYDKLKKHQAFVCKTKLPNSDNNVEKTAINLFVKPATKRNVSLLKRDGVHVMEPATGMLAEGYVAKGRMPEPEEITAWVENLF